MTGLWHKGRHAALNAGARRCVQSLACGLCSHAGGRRTRGAAEREFPVGRPELSGWRGRRFAWHNPEAMSWRRHLFSGASETFLQALDREGKANRTPFKSHSLPHPSQTPAAFF